MRNMYYSWRFYSFGRERYQECMSKIFINNLSILRQSNIIAAVMAGCFTFFPIIVERDLLKAGVYMATAVIALLLAVFTNYKIQGALVTNRLIYLLTTAYYANIIGFGIFLGVWGHSDNYAVTFMCILICALSLFINPPLFNLCLTLGATVLFVTTSVITKESEYWIFDICNALFAGFISLFLSWQISKLRLGMELSANMLEEERNKYLDQSTIDELTKLKNRRDFMQTFQRYVVNYRTTDDWLCIAICDIDFFKNYNDHYGHQKGDDCLCAIGGVFNSLMESMGVYSARVGGEEFALLWFEKEVSCADKVVSMVAELVRNLKIPHEKSKVAPYVTLSMGVYIIRCGSSSDMHTLYDLADKALYIAKSSGRNCAIVSGTEIKQYKITPAY